jgi:membrane protease YdiL (CAAX protease family)
MNPAVDLLLTRHTVHSPPPPPPAPPPAKSRPPRKPRVWSVFLAWIGAVIFGQLFTFMGCIMAGIGIGVVLGFQGVDPATIQTRVVEIFQHPIVALVLTLVPFQLGMLAMVTLAARWSPEPMRERLGLVPSSGRPVSRLRMAMLAAFTLSTALMSAIGLSLFLGDPAASPISTAISDGSWIAVTLTAVLLSLVPAIIEEVVFRGYIQRRLLARWSPSVAIGVSTLLFAIIHADSLQHVLAVVPLGIVTGLLAHRTGSIKAGMLVHAIHNAGAVGFGAMARLLSPHLGDDGAGLVLIGVVVALGLVGLPAIISLVRRGEPTGEIVPSSLPAPTVESLAS